MVGVVIVISDFMDVAISLSAKLAIVICRPVQAQTYKKQKPV